MLKCKNLNFAYFDKKILSDINFEFKKGDFVGILGANGSGKSTLFKSILGILKHSGDVYIDGKNTKETNFKELSNLIGYIPQKSGLLMPLSVRDFILMGLYSQNAFKGYGKKENEKLDEVLEFLNINEFKHRNVISLSGGEFSKVLMARAIIKKPKVLLLDEPMAALDLNYAIFLMNMCKKLSQSGVLVVMIIHELNLACRFCSHFLALKNGKVALNGDKDLVFSEKSLKDIFNLDCEVINHNDRLIVSY